MNLFELKKGQKCLIDKVYENGTIKRRLLDIGLVENTIVECVDVSPLGDPKAFLIRGGVIALRKNDCKNIFIKELIQ